MHFSRPRLTENVTNQLLSDAPPLTSLFLTAPRRTGKSTFVREDLRPSLEAKGALVVYVDLWENKNADPAEIISKGILKELASHNVTSKWLSGIENVNLTIAGVGLGVQKEAKNVDLTLTEALVELSDKTKKKIVLIIDEVQHSLTSSNGENALFALKAARDEVNSSLHHGMIVLGTGSNQDKLASLQNSKDQAFYLTPLMKLPLLGKEYAFWVAEKSGFGLDKDKVWDVFQKTECKPEIINGALRQMRLDLELDADFDAVFEQSVLSAIQKDKEYQTQKITSLPTTQWAVLVFLAKNNGARGLFEAQSLRECEKISSLRGEQIRFNATKMQAALSALQDKKFIWNEKRGTYHIEDEQIVEILKGISIAKPAPKMK